MAAFLKIVSGVYLAFIWFAFFLTVSTPSPLTSISAPLGPHGSGIIAFVIAIGLSIPAVALFAFGQVVGDVRIMGNHVRMQSDHLQAMRAYYEPERRQRIG
jgi:hypothetical protein